MNKQQSGGRTPWDFATELLRVLGRLAPSAIIVSGFLIIGYFFYQEVNKARHDTDKQLQEQVDTAQKRLVETYEKMAGMSGQIIGNIKSLVDLNANIDKDIEKNRDKLKNLVKDNQVKLEVAKREVVVAKALVDEAKALVEEAKMQVTNVEFINLLYDRIRGDLNDYVENVYVPFIINFVLEKELKLFNSEKGAVSMFALLSNALKDPSDPNSKKLILSDMKIFLIAMQKQTETYRKKLHDPVYAHEQEILKKVLSGDIQEGDLKDLQRGSNMVMEYVNTGKFSVSWKAHKMEDKIKELFKISKK